LIDRCGFRARREGIEPQDTDLQDSIQRGRKGSARLTQIGGAIDRDSIVIPDIRLNVGGKDANLPEGKLFSRPVRDDGFHGLVGMDILSQSDKVTTNFCP